MAQLFRHRHGKRYSSPKLLAEGSVQTGASCDQKSASICIRMPEEIPESNIKYGTQDPYFTYRIEMHPDEALALSEYLIQKCARIQEMQENLKEEHHPKDRRKRLQCKSN